MCIAKAVVGTAGSSANVGGTVISCLVGVWLGWLLATLVTER